MNAPTFLSILKNIFKGLNEINIDARRSSINYDDKGSGTYNDNYNYNLISKLFEFIGRSNVYSKSGKRTSLNKYIKNKYLEKLGIQTGSNKIVEDDKVKITYGSDTEVNN